MESNLVYFLDKYLKNCFFLKQNDYYFIAENWETMYIKYMYFSTEFSNIEKSS